MYFAKYLLQTYHRSSVTWCGDKVLNTSSVLVFLDWVGKEGLMCSSPEWAQLTRMSSKRSGERIKAVNVLDTTVGGLFSGSLNRCCEKKPFRSTTQDQLSLQQVKSFSPVHGSHPLILIKSIPLMMLSMQGLVSHSQSNPMLSGCGHVFLYSGKQRTTWSTACISPFHHKLTRKVRKIFGSTSLPRASSRLRRMS